MPTKSKQKKSPKPEFLKQLEQNKFNIDEYLKDKLGREPYVNNSKRRWRFLIAIAKFIYEKKIVRFEELVRWIAKNCECMKIRTLKEGYLEYLAILGIADWNESAKLVKWKGETFEDG